jgi:hypothetical protein
MYFGKMWPDSFPRTEEEISSGSSVRWQSVVISDAQGYWTHSFSECPNDDAVYSECSLQDILQPSVAPKYSLSPTACKGILRRAAKRGKTLPSRLQLALEEVAMATETPGTATTLPERLAAALEDVATVQTPTA